MHNITFVNKPNFLKVYNNFVLKWLILALCVVVVPRTDIVREHLEDTLRICDVSAKGVLTCGLFLTTTQTFHCASLSFIFFISMFYKKRRKCNFRLLSRGCVRTAYCDKSGTSCYHLVYTRLVTVTDLLQLSCSNKTDTGCS